MRQRLVRPLEPEQVPERVALAPTVGVKRVALTGGIATGKSYVRSRFEELGVPTIDADVLAHEAVAPGTPGLAEIVELFGQGVLDRTGALDRRKLGAIIFSDPVQRGALELIVHPEVRRRIGAWFQTLNPIHRYAIADIPLLFETGREADFQTVLVAACSPDEQIRRMIKRDYLSEAEARQRLSAQLPIDEKISRANFVIRTDGPFEETDKQVIQVHEALMADA